MKAGDKETDRHRETDRKKETDRLGAFPIHYVRNSQTANFFVRNLKTAIIEKKKKKIL